MSATGFGVPAGPWRWAALGFVLLALAAAGLTLMAPQVAGLAGYALLGGIALVALLFLAAVWPRPGRATQDALRVAEAAAKANIAWAITGEGGAVLDCNPVYRRMAGAGETESPPPPELALAGEPSAAVLYRLSRDAAEGRAREESFVVMPGLEIVAAVRPLPDKQTAWWFTPRLASSTSAQPVLTRAVQAQPAPQKAQDVPAPAAPVPAAPPAPQTRQNIADLFCDAPMGVAFADSDGRITNANAALAKFFGVSQSLTGKNLGALVDASERAPVLAMIARAAKGEAGLKAVDLRGLKSGNGEERMAELFACPFQDGGAVLYLLDVSEQKALETKFAQSQKMQAVGQLAGGVAHDFNNLLTVIIGNCEFLLMRHQAGDPSFKDINEVHQNALRAAALVSQLLAFSRKQTMQPKTLALGDVVGELAQMLRRLVGEGISLKLEREPDLWPVHADEAQLGNAIINLVVNARDAMPSGGTVTIRTANQTVNTATPLGTAIMPPGDYVRIEVADTGTGMSKEIQSKIFDPFFTTKPVGQGTGLGLATVYGIVKQSDGWIEVSSKPGEGTTFRIFLPVHIPAANEEAPVPMKPARPVARDLSGAGRILFVEDEDAVRGVAAKLLRARGYEVIEAASGEEALELAEQHAGQIDLMISDVVMPGMQGTDLLKQARPYLGGAPVMFISGYAEAEFSNLLEGERNVSFLPKPIDIKTLAERVKLELQKAA